MPTTSCGSELQYWYKLEMRKAQALQSRHNEGKCLVKCGRQNIQGVACFSKGPTNHLCFVASGLGCFAGVLPRLGVDASMRFLFLKAIIEEILYTTHPSLNQESTG